MRFHSWTSVTLRRLYIGQFLSLHFKDRDEDFLSKGLKDILHDNKIFSCTMELPNESTSLVVILFCFVFIWDESVTSCVNQKYRKSFYSYDKNKLFSYDKVSRSSLVPNLSTWQFYFPCRLFFLSFFLFAFFFRWSWIKFFFMEILLVIRNICIAMSEIECVFRRAAADLYFRCSYLKNCTGCKI